MCKFFNVFFYLRTLFYNNKLLLRECIRNNFVLFYGFGIFE